MEKESSYENDGLDSSEEYFRKKKKGNDEDTYFPSEESEHFTFLFNLLFQKACSVAYSLLAVAN